MCVSVKEPLVPHLQKCVQVMQRWLIYILSFNSSNALFGLLSFHSHVRMQACMHDLKNIICESEMPENIVCMSKFQNRFYITYCNIFSKSYCYNRNHTFLLKLFCEPLRKSEDLSIFLSSFSINSILVHFDIFCFYTCK